MRIEGYISHFLTKNINTYSSIFTTRVSLPLLSVRASKNRKMDSSISSFYLPSQIHTDLQAPSLSFNFPTHLSSFSATLTRAAFSIHAQLYKNGTPIQALSLFFSPRAGNGTKNSGFTL